MIEEQSFFSIAENFKAVFLDSYGVIKNYNGLIKGVQETFEFLRSKNIAIRILNRNTMATIRMEAVACQNHGKVAAGAPFNNHARVCFLLLTPTTT